MAKDIEKLTPELSRRKFMTGTWKAVNVAAFMTLGGFLGGLPVMASSSGHADALLCYECRACAVKCPWHYDPAGYAIAARTNNPNRRMLAQIPVRRYNTIICGAKYDIKSNVMMEGSCRNSNLVITLQNLYERDKHIRVMMKGEDRPISVQNALKRGFSDEQLLECYEMRARDAAFYDPLCLNCEPQCPVNLNITKYIRDLKADGKYR